jgi:hypothetical protein
MPVFVVRDVLAQCGEQVSFAVDEDAVEALAADAAYPFREGVAVGAFGGSSP